MLARVEPDVLGRLEADVPARLEPDVLGRLELAPEVPARLEPASGRLELELEPEVPARLEPDVLGRLELEEPARPEPASGRLELAGVVLGCFEPDVSARPVLSAGARVGMLLDERGPLDVEGRALLDVGG